MPAKVLGNNWLSALRTPFVYYGRKPGHDTSKQTLPTPSICLELSTNQSHNQGKKHPSTTLRHYTRISSLLAASTLLPTTRERSTISHRISKTYFQVATPQTLRGKYSVMVSNVGSGDPGWYKLELRPSVHPSIDLRNDTFGKENRVRCTLACLSAYLPSFHPSKCVWRSPFILQRRIHLWFKEPEDSRDHEGMSQMG